MLPAVPKKVVVPPLKCQGIKTKLVPFIMGNVQWDGRGRWIEPFLGSGVVLFTVQPPRALVADTNPHIIAFYRALYEGHITPQTVRVHLTAEGRKLAEIGADYYYEVRARFNAEPNPLDFLFLNRASFNGLMRFNSKGAFNVPFCRKPERFRKSYVTKIANQVAQVQQVMAGKAWEFRVADWQETLQEARAGDFVYLDPPYVGRHADYYSRWDEEDARKLAEVAATLPCGLALSMWKENKFRRNPHLEQWAAFTVERTFEHFYHLGATEALRHTMTEALLVKKGYVVASTDVPTPPEQLPLGL